MLLILFLIGLIILYTINDRKLKNNNTNNNIQNDVKLYDDHIEITKPNKKIKKLSRKCPHAGCNVNYENNQFVCPCHQSKFDIEGHVLEGPATSDLAPYN